MRLECRYHASLCRDEEFDYVRAIEIAVMEFDLESDEENEYTVGRLVINKILWRDAQDDGESLMGVCDADSEGLCEVHRVLTKAGDPQELRDDLEIYDAVDEVLFVHRVLLHPDIEDRVAVLDAAFKAVTTVDALVVMWNNVPYNTQFTEKEFAALCFAKIAGEELIYRDLHYTSKFDEECPRGRYVEFAATAEHEHWIQEYWEHLDDV